MHQDHHRRRRRTAAQEFIQSLGELEHVLKSDAPETPMQSVAPAAAEVIEQTAVDWENVLDEAVADIEHYMEQSPSDVS
ncbi:hypothetical protein XM38_047690 [Halomicronema hongdechloris C2206]|uniref:Uncharacterized protein n=1 Tax=Halomicronema hongdechloris C2206 TaxID=1641165 RepID=A0A1Z3HU34_9CYAN|nr:hypothetical protein [Halomicronema hongdechloris]ASC73796.1 hypothetical protein XM38_047690 [Halomicronema hongdechloris C2206]